MIFIFFILSGLQAQTELNQMDNFDKIFVLWLLKKNLFALQGAVMLIFHFAARSLRAHLFCFFFFPIVGVVLLLLIHINPVDFLCVFVCSLFSFPLGNRISLYCTSTFIIGSLKISPLSGDRGFRQL